MDLTFLARTPLFHGVAPQEITAMLGCLHAREQSFSKGQIIYAAGACITAMGMVLEGSVCIQRDDFWGNTSVLASVSPGQMFAETYSCIPHEPLMVSVVAEKPCTVLFLETPHMLQVCSNQCGFHQRLVQNLLVISAQKNLALSQKIAFTTAKTIRGRLLTYLSAQASEGKRPDFTIPFNRQQLADYLNVERSALSNELSKMQRDGLLTVSGRHFVLKVQEGDLV